MINTNDIDVKNYLSKDLGKYTNEQLEKIIRYLEARIAELEARVKKEKGEKK
jgi:hypothetical protein